jgi:hypothetical protein
MSYAQHRALQLQGVRPARGDAHAKGDEQARYADAFAEPVHLSRRNRRQVALLESIWALPSVEPEHDGRPPEAV